MVIGSLFYRRPARLAFLMALSFVVLMVRSMADDQIVKNDGTVITGTITSSSDGQVTMQSITSRGGIAKIPYPLSDIKSVTMATLRK